MGFERGMHLGAIYVWLVISINRAPIGLDDRSFILHDLLNARDQQPVRHERSSLMNMIVPRHLNLSPRLGWWQILGVCNPGHPSQNVVAQLH